MVDSVTPDVFSYVIVFAVTDEIATVTLLLLLVAPNTWIIVGLVGSKFNPAVLAILTVVELVDPGIPLTVKVSPTEYPDPGFAISNELGVPPVTVTLTVALEPVPPQRGIS